MPCRPAPACGAVLLQASELWPDRKRASDGICASAQHHAQNPGSDHEPDARGIAHAVDLTHDPTHGVDVDVILAQIIARRDPRVKYAIRNKRIWRSYKTSAKQPAPWTPQAYTGPNPHEKHLHISVWTEHENDTSPWFTSAAPSPHPIEEDDDMPQPTSVVAALSTPTDDGVWLLQYDGGVRTTGKAQFYGSYPGLPAKDRQGTRGFVAIEPHEGGYQLIADDGAVYRFGAKK